MGRFPGQNFTNSDAIAVERFTKKATIWPRKINHLKDAELGRLLTPNLTQWRWISGPEIDQFSGLNIIDIAGSNNIKPTCFTAGYPVALLRVPDATKDQGANAVAIAQGK